MKEEKSPNRFVHIKLISLPWREEEEFSECAECATSCQSACKTSCTLGNVPCIKKRR